MRIYKEVSVGEALKRGQLMINVPITGFMFLCIGLTIYLSINYAIYWFIPIGFLLAFVLSWFYWSIMITKWRLWAFSNVRNVHELRQRAVEGKLIWQEGSIYEKTEIRSKKEREKWKNLQSKFDKTDIFYDDFTVGQETEVFVARDNKYLVILILSFYTLIAGYLITTMILYGINIVIFILSLVFISIALIPHIKAFLKLKKIDTQAKITLNSRGIKTISTEFYEWKDVKNEDVIMEDFGNDAYFYLVYDFPSGSEYLSISEYDISPKKLKKLLKIYRGRYLANKSSYPN